MRIPVLRFATIVTCRVLCGIPGILELRIKLFGTVIGRAPSAICFFIAFGRGIYIAYI